MRLPGANRRRLRLPCRFGPEGGAGIRLLLRSRRVAWAFRWRLKHFSEGRTRGSGEGNPNCIIPVYSCQENYTESGNRSKRGSFNIWSRALFNLNRTLRNRRKFPGFNKPSTENRCVGGSSPPLATRKPEKPRKRALNSTGLARPVQRGGRTSAQRYTAGFVLSLRFTERISTAAYLRLARSSRSTNSPDLRKRSLST